jgi:hypothetical protein
MTHRSSPRLSFRCQRWAMPSGQGDPSRLRRRIASRRREARLAGSGPLADTPGEGASAVRLHPNWRSTARCKQHSHRAAILAPFLPILSVAAWTPPGRTYHDTNTELVRDKRIRRSRRPEPRSRVERAPSRNRYTATLRATCRKRPAWYRDRRCVAVTSARLGAALRKHVGQPLLRSGNVRSLHRRRHCSSSG